MNASDFKKSVLSAVVFFMTLGILSVAYAAFTSVPSVTSGQTLTASWWNLVASNLNDHETRIAKLDSAAGEFISIALAQCSGPCASYHALNTWTNAGAQNYAWGTSLNTASDNFTHNGKGTITVAKSGLYRIRLQAMFIPVDAHPYGQIVCPAINGTANCGYNSTFGYNHRTATAGWWSQPQHEFVMQLTAGNTVAWAYQPATPLTYWAHDGYVALEMTRIR